MLRVPSLIIAVAGMLSGLTASGQTTPPAYQPPDFDKIMITEVSWGEPDGLEITNFSTIPASLANWTVVWNDGASVTSQPLSGTVQPGESVVVIEPGTAPEAPPGTQILQVLPPRGTTTGACDVTLRNASGTVIDGVRISNVGGTNSLPGFGGVFRGLAVRGALAGSVSVERIWGLDSDGGLDWTEETVRSFGLENRSSGPRGTDPVSVPSLVLITEVDDSPDYQEIYNLSFDAVALNRWLVVYSNVQGGTRVTLRPFEGIVAPLLNAGAYLVFGSTASPPAELPAGTTYVNLASFGTFSLTANEYSLALYDSYGRLVDMVRVTGHDDEVVQNHPRLPSAPDGFRGAVLRAGSFGGGTIGRRIGTFGYISTRSGSSFQPCFTRTMGAANTDWYGTSGLSSPLDVRLNGTAPGGGLAIIINSSPSQAGRQYSFLFSLGHLAGTGPFFGLGADALTNWEIVLASPPFSGALDARGSARVDIPSGALPAGLDLDTVFILQDAAGLYVGRTAILEFDA